jgi:hypothetical protein
MTPACMVEPDNFHIHDPKHVVGAVSIDFGRCCDGHENLFSCGVHARSCLALGSRPSESSGILREILILETFINA